MRKKIILFFLVVLVGMGVFLYSQKIENVVVNDSDTETVVVFKFSSSDIVFPDVLRSEENPAVIKLIFNNNVFTSPEQFKNIEKKGAFSGVEYINEKSISIRLSEVLPFKVSGNEKSGEIIFRIFKDNLKKETVNVDRNKSVHIEKEDNYLIDLEKKVNGNRIEIIFMFSRDLPAYDVFYVDNPRRLVLDFYGVINGVKTSRLSGSGNEIAAIRVGQNRLSPDPVSRAVFDLNVNEINYEIKEKGDRLIVSVKGREPLEVVEPEKIKTQPVKKEAVHLKKAKMVKEEHAKFKVINKESAQPPAKFQGQKIHSEEEKYTGDLITLRFKDADIRDVLRQIAIHAGLNLIIDPGVTGKVTCELVALPWDQALDLILRSNNLGYIREGNVLRVGKVEVLTQEEERRRKLLESKKLAGPLEVLTRTLSYAKAKRLSDLLKKQLSERGSIIVDERTNTLIISDVKEKIKVIDKLIDTLDTPNLQVTIEARIVETTTNYSKNLGIQWGFKGIVSSYYGNQTNLQFPNNIIVSGNSVASQSGIYGPLEGYAVNLPAPAYSSGIGISLGNVLDTFRLDAALTALEDQGKARILSTPRVTTQDNTKAAIIQGQMIPVQTVAYNTVTTRYVNAALELHVTPHITAEGTVIMDIEIKNDNADFSHLVNGIPPIITQSAKTTVLVRDGGTTVIGGIYKVENSETRNNVPGLSKIPILGYLFKGSQKVGTNRELLIFITPRIVK